MFDDILGKPVKKVKPVLDKNVKPASVGGVESPEGMKPKKPYSTQPIKGIDPGSSKDQWDLNDLDEDELQLELEEDDEYPDSDQGCDGSCGGDCCGSKDEPCKDCD